jgi:hypothetical protein
LKSFSFFTFITSKMADEHFQNIMNTYHNLGVDGILITALSGKKVLFVRDITEYLDTHNVDFDDPHQLDIVTIFQHHQLPKKLYFITAMDDFVLDPETLQRVALWDEMFHELTIF